MLVTDDWRLTTRNDVEWGDVYDFKNDPSEIHNLDDEAGASIVRS